MNQQQWGTQGTVEQRRTNGAAGDMSTGLRPCPFCHSVIPWGSETCPSCGRVLIERSESGPRRVSAQRVPSGPSLWWKKVLAPRLTHLRAVIRSTMTDDRFAVRPSATRDSWSTTTRGTSWSVFQPAGRPSHSWWPRSLPRPTDQERTTLVVTAAVMVILFVAALIGVKR